MYGLKQKLNDGQLYLLHDMTEGLLAAAKNEFAETPSENIEKKIELLLRIERFKKELSAFEKDIMNQREQSFQFSVEELYYMYGQYDKFLAVEFHKFSEAAKKYGKEAGGIIVYGRNERKNLEALIDSGGPIGRTNGIVKFDVASNYNLTEKQAKEILEEGFMSGDVYHILSTNSPVNNAYAQEGLKKIPGTVTVPFSSIGTHPVKMSYYVLNMRLQQERPLCKQEWDKYLGYTLWFHSELKDLEGMKRITQLPDGSIRSEVRFYELLAKNHDVKLSAEELKEMSRLINTRTMKRLELLKEEIVSNNYQSLEKFRSDHPDIFKEIHFWAMLFEDESLSMEKYPLSVYWDFRSYLHIFLRHCKDFQPTGTFAAKTPFAYTQKDIRRVLKIAVEQLEPKIQERLQQGKDFRIYGEKSLYFNGNYYFMRVEPNGRIESFHPYEP